VDFNLFIARMEEWNAGILEYWVEKGKKWNIGMMECWNIGKKILL